MTEEKRNLAASVLARLLNRAKQTGDNYQVVLRSYYFERFLYRLGRSDARARFVLKGATLLHLWSGRPYRATRDLDLLRTGDGSHEAIRRDLEAICSVPVEPDAVVFGTEGIRIEAIRAEDEYAGTRALLPARCGSARLVLQVDMGLGDAVWPAPESRTYPTLLEFAPPEILSYPREAVVAEKLEAVVVLGERNSRIKDFFDLHFLASRFEFDRRVLTEAVRRTFVRRRTALSAEPPIGLTHAYWENPSRPDQVRAFARRAEVAVPADPGREINALLGEFLLPILDDVRRGHESGGSWPPGGPWREEG